MGGGSSDAYLSENDERRSIFNNAVGVNFAPVKKGTQAGTDATLEIKILSEDAAKKQVLSRQPTRQFVTVEQVAALTVFLASQEAASITGSNYSIDGGWTAQ